MPLEQGGALEQVGARMKRVMGLTAKVSGWLKASPLERRVRPEGQKEAPDLNKGAAHEKALGHKTGAALRE